MLTVYSFGYFFSFHFSVFHQSRIGYSIDFNKATVMDQEYEFD